MKPRQTLAEARSPDGGKLILQRHDREFMLLVNGQVLMTSRMRASELALARVAADDLRARGIGNPRVLVGGLGLALTLRALLDRLPQSAHVTVAELSPAIVEWNRTLLGELSGDALSDPRVEVEVADVAKIVARRPGAFDAILLDVDNGPTALTSRNNHALYGATALRAAERALTAGGLYVVWSAGPDPAFARRMGEAGFRVDLRTETSGGAKHVLFCGHRRTPTT